MKIQCDVCAAEQATVFCTADEAALCERCDHKVHQANKLAKKHRRFSLVHPSCNNEAPLCDICQEKRAFLFCKEDRAISCRECDFSIHQANELTQMHHRYLLTGVKLSASSSVYQFPTFPSSSQDSILKVKSSKSTARSRTNCSTDQVVQRSESSSLSNNSVSNSISEYLETLPGWHYFDPSNNYDAFFFFELVSDPISHVLLKTKKY